MPTLIESLVTPCVVLDPDARFVAPIASVASTKVAAQTTTVVRRCIDRAACFVVLIRPAPRERAACDDAAGPKAGAPPHVGEMVERGLARRLGALAVAHVL